MTMLMILERSAWRCMTKLLILFCEALCASLRSEWLITTAPSPHCVHNMSTMPAVCKWLGLPLHLGKCEGPTTVLVVLGIELDSINQAARLPADKLLALQGLISSWLPSRRCNRHKLESLISHLHYAANVVWPGRTFLHCTIDLLCCFCKKDHPICLNRKFHLDLLW